MQGNVNKVYHFIRNRIKTKKLKKVYLKAKLARKEKCASNV